MISRIKARIPDSTKILLKRQWQKLCPPRLRVTRFIENGCSFEITSRMERFRVTGYGDEPDSIERVLSEVRPGDVFYDIGSCVGMYSLHAALLGSVVVAFEPDPSYRKRLKRNIQINGLSRKVSVLDWAVSDAIGVAPLYTNGLDGKSPSLRQEGDRGSTIVRTNTIDNAISSGEIAWPQLIKIDVEGAEILALRGMRATLSAHNAPRRLFVELHPGFLSAFGSSVDECDRIIQSGGYRRSHVQERSEQLHVMYTKGPR